VAEGWEEGEGDETAEVGTETGASPDDSPTFVRSSETPVPLDVLITILLISSKVR
jgi:hypothetical protein